MSNIDKQAVTAKTKELASLMVERFSMNPVSCKLLNEAWEKEFPDEVAIAERMLALLDENIQLQREKDATEAVALALRDDMRDAREKLEAAERRIAEHCKVLNSLAAVARRYLPDYDEHPEIQAADELLESAAGIGVKQQEDIVDSDVGSRNQPGTVTAIYIGAGDFVKVKGQVFEVEETDFDDHDVTLWLVGGNALKCSAGCPVEVVSAPVAADIKVKEE